MNRRKFLKGALALLPLPLAGKLIKAASESEIAEGEREEGGFYLPPLKGYWPMELPPQEESLFGSPASWTYGNANTAGWYWMDTNGNWYKLTVKHSFGAEPRGRGE